MKFQNILCPVDFRESSEAAARYAGRIAEQSGGRLTYLHAVPEPNFDYAMTDPTAATLRELSQHRNAAAERALDQFGDGEGDAIVERRLEIGDAASQIVRVARENGHDLIVMPTHGRSAVQRWLSVGSVTTKVLHDAECAVISSVDFSSPSAGFPVSNVLCAVDLGRYSRRVLCTAAGMARESGAGLTVVHAAPSPGDALEDFLDLSWRATLRSNAITRISAMLRELDAPGATVVELGEAYKVVPQVAQRISAGLLVIGRSASNDILGRLRAQAYEIIRRSPCPVLSV